MFLFIISIYLLFFTSSSIVSMKPFIAVKGVFNSCDASLTKSLFIFSIFFIDVISKIVYKVSFVFSIKLLHKR